MFTTPLISKCSHPVRIKDPRQAGSYMYVPCGKCDPCRSDYRKKWMSRLDVEAQSSAAVLFFTLTYDNAHVPLVHIDPYCHALISNRSCDDDFYFDEYHDKGLSIQFNLNHLPKLFRSETPDHSCFGYNCKSDVQKFFKRLRRRLEYDRQALLSNVSASDRSFRYFICSEYGPKTFRPHYHGLLFFRDKRTAQAVKQCYFADSWKLCDRRNIDVQFVLSNACSYVSKYVNCTADLPDILQVPPFRTFHLASSAPAIGASMCTFSELVNKVECHSLTYTKNIVQQDSFTSVQLPLPSQLTNYYFPKLYHNADYDYYELCSFYSNVYKYFSLSDLKRIQGAGLLDLAYLSSRLPNVISDVNNMLNIVRLNNPKSTLSDIYDTLSPFQRIFGISQNRCCLIRFAVFSVLNNFTLYDYVNIMLRSRTVKASASMEAFYRAQDYLINSGFSPVQVVLFCYPDFLNSIPNILQQVDFGLECSYDLFLNSFGCQTSDFYDKYGNRLKLKDFDFSQTEIYQSYLSYLKDESVEFNKTRMINHNINLQSKNYESF